MNVLVTAGNTRTPIDRVRCITNIFTGRTGAAVAREAHRRGHAATLLTSHPEAVEGPPPAERWAVLRYDTFDDLHAHMARLTPGGTFDAIIHCAAVSDYRAAGVYGPAAHTRFRPEDGTWESLTDEPPALVDRAAGKVKSDEPELWLRLVRTPKLIDFVRGEWGFRGVLVKFKLEVGVSDERLLEIAERSRRQSAADLMAANTLEGAGAWAFLGPVGGQYQRVSRRELAARLLGEVERLHEERTRG
ncbi:MAG TPA: phosphopantothenoylcysteine decarboxylase [Gemmataceae bacterium]|nr:phosphopantothenoylcysteine decarboxylase [Gemmataceae bacterium]